MLGYTIRQEDIDLLKKLGMDAEDLDHSIKVAEKALEIAGRMKVEIDLELVGRGALFHDLGKTETHGITHGLLGAEKGQELGLPEEINTIMEKHIRGGLTESEAEELGLPVKSYALHLLEERVIIYADRLVDIIHEEIDEINDELEAETRFKEILRDEIKYGKNEATTERYCRYHDEIQSLMK